MRPRQDRASGESVRAPFRPGGARWAWKDANLRAWAAQRLVLAVLDACGGPLAPAKVVESVAARTRWHGLREDSSKFQRRGSAVELLADGRWAIGAGAAETLRQTRVAVRERVALARRYAAMRSTPAEIARSQAAWEQRRAVHRAELAGLSRALLVGFPAARPEAVALLDVGGHELATFVGAELAGIGSRLAAHDVLGAMDVRALLRALGFDPGARRLAELGPPQKTITLDRRGRTLKLTTALLVQGSCGLARPFADEAKLAGYLADGEHTRLRRRLEADVKSLHALHAYGRLHGVLRLRWGFLDERRPAPWVHPDEPTLHDLMKSALAMRVPLEVVVGSAPGWEEPWSRVRLATVATDGSSWRRWLVDEAGRRLDEGEVQLARLPAPVR